MKFFKTTILLLLSSMIFTSCVSRSHHYGKKYYKRVTLASEKAHIKLDKE